MTTKTPKTKKAEKKVARVGKDNTLVAAALAVAVHAPETKLLVVEEMPIPRAEMLADAPTREKWQWSPAKHSRFAARERFREFNQRTGTWLYKLSGVACFQRDVLAYLRSLEDMRDGVTA